MATIIEKRKDGKLVSYKFRSYLGKQNDGRQIAKYCTWQIPEGLSPTRARKAAEEDAAEWEKEVRFVYERDIKEPERAAIYASSTSWYSLNSVIFSSSPSTPKSSETLNATVSAWGFDWAP